MLEVEHMSSKRSATVVLRCKKWVKKRKPFKGIKYPATKLTQPLKYPGGKAYLASKIVALFPKRYLTLCEPYAGGCSVMLAANPNGHSEIVNDLDGQVSNFWMVLQSQGLFNEFQEAIVKTPFSEQEFSVQYHDESVLYQALRFFVLSRQSMAGRRQCFTPISTSRIRRGMNEQVSSWLTAIDGLQEVHERIKRWLILNRPAIDCIKQLDNKGTLFYLDPPYLHETRNTTSEYGQYEMNEKQHEELLQALVAIKGKFILSGYRSDLYDRYARKYKWCRVEFKIANSAAKGKTKRIMTECCWMNYK